MAMLANRVWVWVHRGTSSDRRTGFVEMSDADARGAIVGGRAQDPMLGAARLKHIDYTIPAPGMAPPDPPPEDGEGEAPAEGEEKGTPDPVEESPGAPTPAPRARAAARTQTARRRAA